MTAQEYQLLKLQFVRLKEKLHKRFVYADAISFTKTLLAIEKYEQSERTRSTKESML